jgi:hypothetical protein
MTAELTNFITYGYICGRINFIKQINFDKFNFGDCNDDNCELDNRLLPILNKTYSHLAINHISEYFPDHKLLNMNAWSGVDTPSAVWHNDLAEGFNSNIIVYLDESIDNTIEIKSKTCEFKICPKVGTFVWINQSNEFQHRATHVSGKRRVLSYELWI